MGDAMFGVLALGDPQFQATLRNVYLLQWVMSNAYQVLAATVNASGVITSANVAWPNQCQGVYTLLQQNASFPVADSFSITYTNGLITRIVTQPAGCTRNEQGAILTCPPLTIT